MQELLTVQKLLHWRMEKLNAEAHIDEIIKTSEDKNKGRPNTPDENNLHGDMAKDGWRYREAYFMDHDGKYYGLTLSVAYGRDGKVAYNIANIKERSFPQIYGSSNPRTGAQGGGNFSERYYITVRWGKQYQGGKCRCVCIRAESAGP